MAFRGKYLFGPPPWTQELREGGPSVSSAIAVLSGSARRSKRIWAFRKYPDWWLCQPLVNGTRGLTNRQGLPHWGLTNWEGRLTFPDGLFPVSVRLVSPRRLASMTIGAPSECCLPRAPTWELPAVPDQRSMPDAEDSSQVLTGSRLFGAFYSSLELEKGLAYAYLQPLLFVSSSTNTDLPLWMFLGSELHWLTWTWQSR